eukprot:1867893-Pyramimonas_sp.AAC.1
MSIFYSHTLPTARAPCYGCYLLGIHEDGRGREFALVADPAHLVVDTIVVVHQVGALVAVGAGNPVSEISQSVSQTVIQSVSQSVSQ